MEEVALPEQCDVLVSEPMGTLLVNERMLETYLYARDHLLKPGGRMFPVRACGATLVLTPLALTSSIGSVSTAADVTYTMPEMYLAGLPGGCMPRCAHGSPRELIEADNAIDPLSMERTGALVSTKTASRKSQKTSDIRETRLVFESPRQGLCSRTCATGKKVLLSASWQRAALAASTS